jgi:hypothetical protein
VEDVSVVLFERGIGMVTKAKVSKKVREALLNSTNLEEYRAAGGNESSSVNQRIVGDLVHREVVCCISSTVSALLKVASECRSEDFDYDDFVAREFGQDNPRQTRPSRQQLWRWVGIAVFLALVLGYLLSALR